MRRAQWLAEAAFDAAVDDVFSGRHRLEVLQVRLWVVVDDHSGIQPVVGIEERLDPAHQVGGLPAPFHLDKGCHVAACSVFGLERTVVLVDDQFADLVHEAGVTFHLCRI